MFSFYLDEEKQPTHSFNHTEMIAHPIIEKILEKSNNYKDFKLLKLDIQLNDFKHSKIPDNIVVTK